MTQAAVRFGGIRALLNRFLPGRRTDGTARPVLTPPEKEWLGLLLFFTLIALTDRLSNAVAALRPIGSLVYLFAILFIGCWAGLRSALGACALLLTYAWAIYHFYPISAVARGPEFATTALIFTAVIYPPFAILGGVVHIIVRRAGVRESSARADAERELGQRRTAEAELWASEEMRRLIVDSSIDAIIGIAPDRTISFWSPNAEKLFGWTMAEAIGCPVGSRLLVSIPASSNDANALDLSRPEQPPVLREQIETSAQRRSGESIAVELYIVDHPSDAGTMFVVFARDVSERKLAEQVIRELNAGLEERVTERTRQLKAANEELVGFTHSVSHDLRAPLRAIVSQSRIVCEEAGDGLSEEMVARLKRLETNALKMAQLIDELLQHARIGQVGITSRKVDISAMATRITAELNASTSGSAQIQPDMVGQGDPNLIEMLLTNLMENAWKYVKPGQPPQLEVGSIPEGTIFVRDHGVGFDMTYVEKIWEPFERLHTESEYPGTGIGLANCKRIVERHGGKIWAESVPGEGTTIYFQLGETIRPESEIVSSTAGLI